MEITVNEFTSWLKTKPTNGTYNYVDNKNCLVFQYLKDAGVKVSNVIPGSYEYLDNDGIFKRAEVPDAIEAIAVGGPSGPAIMTYGEALGRALNIQTDQEVNAMLDKAGISHP